MEIMAREKFALLAVPRTVPGQLVSSVTLRWFREVHVCPLVEWPLASAYHVCRCGELYMRKIYILTMIKWYNIWNQATMLNVWICATG